MQIWALHTFVNKSSYEHENKFVKDRNYEQALLIKK